MNDAVRRGRLVLLVSMVALEGRWEEKKKKAAFKMVDIPKRVVEVFLFFMIFIFIFGFGFWFLVFGF